MRIVSNVIVALTRMKSAEAVMASKNETMIDPKPIDRMYVSNLWSVD